MTDSLIQLRHRAESAERALIEAVRQRDLLAAALQRIMPYAENEIGALFEVERRDHEDCGWKEANLALIASEHALQSIQA